MIGISKLYCGTVEQSDPLRYGRRSKDLPSHLLQFSEDKKPVVVWNVGQRCNLRCVHCYSHSRDEAYTGELSTEQGFNLLDDLADFGVPVILFSGGEPLMRKDLFQLITHAVDRNMRAVISTNGTLINEDMAAKLKDFGLSYVGISLDGLQETNDHFRGVEGAFQRALNGVRSCMAVGIKVGLRFTMTGKNCQDVPGIFDLIEKEGIPRVCFYHLVYTGRGTELITDSRISHDRTRSLVDTIMNRTKMLHDAGREVEVLTVDNHTDGPYLHLRLLDEDPARAPGVLELLKMNGGNSSGQGIGCISWDGSIHPDQFWRHATLGNVLERPFSEIWSDTSHDLVRMLRERKKHITGRCAECKWLNICNGNLRVRAEAVTGDIWASEPDCYLTDEEIGLSET